MNAKIPEGKAIDAKTGRTTFDSGLPVVHPASWEYIAFCGEMQVRMGLNWGDVVHAHIRSILGMFEHPASAATVEEKERLKAVLIECIKTGSMEPQEREMAKAIGFQEVTH